MVFRASFLLSGLLVLAACGDDREAAAGVAVSIRAVDAKWKDGNARCDEGEELVNAFCYPDPERTISASGPVFLKQADGGFAVTCLTGGANVRLFCLKR